MQQLVTELGTLRGAEVTDSVTRARSLIHFIQDI